MVLIFLRLVLKKNKIYWLDKISFSYVFFHDLLYGRSFYCFNTFSTIDEKCFNHLETPQLFGSANQLKFFYVDWALVLNVLMYCLCQSLPLPKIIRKNFCSLQFHSPWKTLIRSNQTEGTWTAFTFTFLVQGAPQPDHYNFANGKFTKVSYWIVICMQNW